VLESIAAAIGAGERAEENMDMIGKSLEFDAFGEDHTEGRVFV